ncbi:hypothetical protein HDV64DRAFT_240077 [Trichoderma sp. TUCIM 5745]
MQARQKMKTRCGLLFSCLVCLYVLRRIHAGVVSLVSAQLDRNSSVRVLPCVNGTRRVFSDTCAPIKRTLFPFAWKVLFWV